MMTYSMQWILTELSPMSMANKYDGKYDPTSLASKYDTSRYDPPSLTAKFDPAAALSSKYDAASSMKYDPTSLAAKYDAGLTSKYDAAATAAAVTAPLGGYGGLGQSGYSCGQYAPQPPLRT